MTLTNSFCWCALSHYWQSKCWHEMHKISTNK